MSPSVKLSVLRVSHPLESSQHHREEHIWRNSFTPFRSHWLNTRLLSSHELTRCVLLLWMYALGNVSVLESFLGRHTRIRRAIKKPQAITQPYETIDCHRL